MQMIRRLRIAAAALLIGFCPAVEAPAQNSLVNAGIITLGDFQVGAAGTAVGTPVTGLQGMLVIACQLRFFYGSGGTQANVFVQTSLDQGQTWLDLANVQFGTANGTELINVSAANGSSGPLAPTNLSLTANTVLNGPIGDRLQAVVVSTGTYGSSTLASVRCVVR